MEEKVMKLHEGIAAAADNADELLWNAIIEHQGEIFYTKMGLPFMYVVRNKKNGDLSGELIISRKEESKTLTKSSIMLAFHRILEEITVEDGVIVPTFYKGPKAIGQFFGISYTYSIFWRLGLIAVPEKIEYRLNGNSF